MPGECSSALDLALPLCFSKSANGRFLMNCLSVVASEYGLGESAPTEVTLSGSRDELFVALPISYRI